METLEGESRLWVQVWKTHKSVNYLYYHNSSVIPRSFN